jgi:hypothetical protein
MARKLFTEDWKEFIRLAEEKKLRYLVIGGVALGLHGVVRATRDIDIWVGNTPANIRKLKDVLTAFGFEEVAEQVPARFTTRQVFFLGKEPYRIDVLSGIAGVEFKKAYAARVMIESESLTVPVISLDDMETNKKIAGRPKDLADVHLIQTRARTLKPSGKKRGTARR